MSANVKFDVFLSHNSQDKPWVIKLKNALEARGINVWLDEDEMRPGDLFAKALEQGIQESKALALIISPESMNSGWVEAEYYRAVTLATDKKLQLIPVLYKNAQMPGFLRDRHYVDFSDKTKYNESVSELIWGITGEKTLPNPHKGTTTNPTGSSPVKSEKGSGSTTKKESKKETIPAPKEPEVGPVQRTTQFVLSALTLGVLIWLIRFGISLKLIVPTGIIEWISASANPRVTLWLVSILIASSLIALSRLGIKVGIFKSLAELNQKLFNNLFGLSLWVTIPIVLGSIAGLMILQPVCQSPTATIQVRPRGNEVIEYDGKSIHAQGGSEFTLNASSEDSSVIFCSWSSTGTVIDTIGSNSTCSTQVHLTDTPGRGIITLTLSKSSCSMVTTHPLEVIVVP